MSDLTPSYCAFGSNGFRNVGKAGIIRLVVRAELVRGKHYFLVIVGERVLHNHKSGTARWP